MAQRITLVEAEGRRARRRRRDAKWREKNRARLVAYYRRWRARNPGYHPAWRAANPTRTSVIRDDTWAEIVNPKWKRKRS